MPFETYVFRVLPVWQTWYPPRICGPVAATIQVTAAPAWYTVPMLFCETERKDTRTWPPLPAIRVVFAPYWPPEAVAVLYALHGFASHAQFSPKLTGPPQAAAGAAGISAIPTRPSTPAAATYHFLSFRIPVLSR